MSPEHTALVADLESNSAKVRHSMTLRRRAATAIRALSGDLQLMKLSRDAKLCSECPRIPEWDALGKAGDALAHSLIYRENSGVLDAWWKLRGHGNCTVCAPPPA